MASYQVAGAEFCREPSGEIIVSVPVGQTEPEAVTLRIPVERWVELVATVACPQHERAMRRQWRRRCTLVALSRAKR